MFYSYFFHRILKLVLIHQLSFSFFRLCDQFLQLLVGRLHILNIKQVRLLQVVEILDEFFGFFEVHLFVVQDLLDLFIVPTFFESVKNCTELTSLFLFVAKPILPLVIQPFSCHPLLHFQQFLLFFCL